MRDDYCNKLTHVCRIDNHPIKDMPELIQLNYLKGLAVVLYEISQGDTTMRTLFSQWAYSIMGKDSSYLFQQNSKDCVKKALSINRIGFHFFRCKHDFFFDCFYLTESFDKRLLPELATLLGLVGKNIFTKESLKLTSDFFSGTSKESFLRAAKCLQVHRDRNIWFRNMKQKRVLVVANVSAGKSTLINALLGHKINKVRSTACTSRLCEIYNKPVDDGFVYMKSSQLQFDPEIDTHTSDDSTQIGLHFESTLGSCNICFIDTPGVNNGTNIEHWNITTDAIKKGNYDLVLYVSNGRYNGTTDEYLILDFLKKYTKKPVAFVLNQLDCFNEEDDNISTMISDFQKDIKKIGFINKAVFPISAYYAFLQRCPNQLTRRERFELDGFKERFSDPFYDLSAYGNIKSNTDIEKTGIIRLEEHITKFIKS